MTHGIVCYNPRVASHETLEAMLVGRHQILNELMSDLAAQATSRSRQHWVIRAPRGYGKTHLIGILYYRVRKDDALGRRFLPVWLSESAAYGIYSAGTLLVAIVEQLIEELRRGGDAGAAAALHNAISDITHGGDEAALFEEVCALLKGAARERKTILLVLMENLDALLHGFASTRKRVEERRLRALLAEEHELLFISTTPTQYLEDLSSPDSPLYGHLRERRLEGLSEGEIAELFSRLAHVADSPQVAQLLEGSQEEVRLRRRVLHRLAGGSPRSAVIAFQAISGGHGVQTVVEEFAATLDAHTPYFEARLAHLAPRERAIVTAMALAPANLTIKEIAARTRLDERSLSTQVKRLVLEGFLSPTGGRGGKGEIYEIRDGLFRLWYHYRKGSQVLEPLVRFLALWNPPETLEASYSELLAEHLYTSPFRDMRELAKRQIAAALEYARSEEGQHERERLWATCRKEVSEEALNMLPAELVRDVNDAIRGREVEPLVEAVRRIMAYLDSSASTLSMGARADAAVALIRSGLTLGELGMPDREIACYDQVIGRLGGYKESPILEQVARALFNKSVTLRSLGKTAEELNCYDEVIGRFGDRSEPRLLEKVAMVLVNKGATLGRTADALDCYDEVIRRFGDRSELSMLEAMTRALFNKGVTLGSLGKIDEELACYDEVIKRFGDRSEPGLLEHVASALFNKGVTLGSLGKAGDALACFDELIKRFSDRSEPSLLEQVARALVNKGSTLGSLGKTDDALACFDEVIKRFGDRSDPSLLQGVARALVNKGVGLRTIGKSHDALACFDEVIKRFGDRSEPSLLEQVAMALVGKGLTLRALAQAGDALACFDEVIKRFGDRSEPSLLEGVAMALVNEGATLGTLGNTDDALACYDEVIKRFGDRGEPSLLEKVAMALFNKGVALRTIGKSHDALACYDEVIKRFGDRSEPNLVEPAARALVAKGKLLAELGRGRAAAGALSGFFHLAAKHADALAGAIAERIRQALVWAPLEAAKRELESLAAAGTTQNRETARLFAFVVDVLLAEETSRQRGRGRAARRRRARARVPPEVRKTVEEHADEIAKSRKEFRRHAARHDR